MVRTARLLPALTLMGLALLVAPALAQRPAEPDGLAPPLNSSLVLPPSPLNPGPLPPLTAPAAAPVSATEDGSAPAFLKELPRPADQPKSLFQGPSIPVPPGPPLEGSYLQRDPLLDPPGLPPPGWFFNADAAYEMAHVKNRLVNTVTVAGRTDTIQLESAPMSWTVAPRFEAGYRLPSGFGELSLSYRFLVTDGTTGFNAPDGPGTLRSRLDMNVFDFDYASYELSLASRWQMKARVGLRLAYLYYDSQGTEPFAQAAAGSGMFETRDTNSYVGLGPHAAVDFHRGLDDLLCGWQIHGLGFHAKAGVAYEFGRIRQQFFEASTTLAPNNQLLSGTTGVSSSQEVPMATGELGLIWELSSNRRCFLGYLIDQWWNIGRFSTGNSRGELFNQGVFGRVELDF